MSRIVVKNGCNIEKKLSILEVEMCPEIRTLLDSDDSNNSIKVPAPEQWLGYRHVQVLLSFFLIFLAYGIRVNLSVGIVAMTDPKASSNPDIPTYPEWKDRSVILSSFFWGYLLPQVCAGQLAKKYGSKWFLVSTMLICSMATLLIPVVAAQWGSKGVMTCRAIQGIGQGFVFPMTHDALSKWVPACERSRLGAFVYAGGSCGTVVSMLVTGLISGSWLGWPFVFYLYGCLGFVWVLMMIIFGSDSPYEHKNIKDDEKRYITSGISHSEGECPTPWKKIFTSLPVWSIIIVHCGQNWGFWTLMTEIPTYMSGVMKYNIQENSYLSALPYFTLWILSFLFSEIADKLINKKICSIGTTRKILNSIGLFIPAIALACLGFIDSQHRPIAIGLLVLAVGSNAAIYSGFHINHIDLAPNHSGILMGISNGASNVCALLAPLLVQLIVKKEDNALQWRTVFFIASTIYIATNSIFVIYGSGKLQSWNNVETEPSQEPAVINGKTNNIKRLSK